MLFELRHADSVQESIVNIKALSHQLRGKPGVVQIEEDAIRRGYASGLIFDLISDVDGHTGVVRRRPVADAGDQRETMRAGRSGIGLRALLLFGFVRFVRRRRVLWILRFFASLRLL